MSVIAIISEAVAPMWSELIMFSLAVVVYIFFSKSFLVLDPHEPRPTQRPPVVKVSLPKEQPSTKPRDQQRLPRKESSQTRNHKEEMPAIYVPILQAAKAWDASTALALLAELPVLEQNELPLLVSMRVLLALGKASSLSEEVMHQFSDMAHHFDIKTFEHAAAEASRWRCIPACRQLYRLAGLAPVQRTERFAMLLVRGHANDIPAMRELVQEILAEGSGIVLSRSLADSLASQCSAAGDPEFSERIFERFGKDKESSPAMTPSTSRQAKLISAYGKDGNLAAAQDVFKKLQESSELNSLVYNCLLDACVECNDLKQALEVLSEMKAKGGLADIVSYNTIMKGYLANGDIEAVNDLVSEMFQEGICPNRVSFHSYLHTLVQMDRWSEVWKWVDLMAGRDTLANVVTCSILLRGIKMSSQLQLPKITELSDSCKIPMDEALFGCYADACIRCRLLNLLWDRLQKLTKEGNVKISPTSYGSMMKAYGQAQDVEKVKRLWGHMCSHGVKMTPITLGCMMEALVSNYCAEDARVVVGKIWEDPEQRYLVNTVVYSTIIKGFTMLKQHNRVLAVYKEMKQRRIRCNTITFNTMLNSLARCGMMHEVPMLLEDMKMSDPPVHPDVVTYSTLVKGYCMAGELDKSLELLEEMKRKNDVKPDEVLYNSLLDGCCTQQNLEQALSLLQEMRETGVAPSNYTLSIICKLLGRSRRLEQAFSMVQELTAEYSFRANIQVYTCLMQACFHNRQCKRALDLHDEVVSSRNCCPDEKTYNVMLRGCLQTGSVEKAIEVARCAFHLPGHKMMQTNGAPKGVEHAGLEQLLAASGTSGEALAKDLLELRGVTVTAGTSLVQVPKRGHRNHTRSQ